MSVSHNLRFWHEMDGVAYVTTFFSLIFNFIPVAGGSSLSTNNNNLRAALQMSVVTRVSVWSP